jgi:hypothetical protein
MGKTRPRVSGGQAPKNCFSSPLSELPAIENSYDFEAWAQREVFQAKIQSQHAVSMQSALVDALFRFI